MAEREAGGFGQEVRSQREMKGWTQGVLASKAHMHRTTLTKIEGGEKPSPENIRSLDGALGADGFLIDMAKVEWGEREISLHRADGLCVLAEVAELVQGDGHFVITVERRLQNNGQEPVSSYLAKIQVDRYPEDKVLSRDHHHAHPLEIDQVGFLATLDEAPLAYELKVDGPATKEMYILFETLDGRTAPLYPGHTATLRYRYTVPAGLWGRWFQRAVRLPTDELVIRVTLGADAEPTVWAKEMTYERHGPMRVAPTVTVDADAGTWTFDWRVIDPVIEGRYRIAWVGEGLDELPLEVPAPDLSPTDRMAGLGIIQKGHPALITPVTRFELPEEAELARRHIEQLRAHLDRVEMFHPFLKGSGLAANQVGLPCRALVVRGPGGHVEHLVNPQIVDRSTETDVRFEGCLSFFNVRVQIERPRRIEVRHQTLTGEDRITAFEDAWARLVAHEIDHLDGILCLQRAKGPDAVVPYAEYREGRATWDYDDR